MTATASTATPTWTPPSPGELLAAAAAKSSATVEEVETVLREAGIRLPSPIPPHRRIKALRLRVDGVKKNGEQIKVDQRLDTGVWAIMHPSNSAGKTSLLEFLVWALRGRPRDLPKHVKAWVRRVAVDVIVSGQYVRVVLTQDVSTGRPHVSAVLLSADTEDQLLTVADDALHTLVAARGEEPVEQLLGAFMRESLGLDYTELWDKTGGLDGEGAGQVHGWPAYFGACYLNPGGDKLLFGDVQSLSAKLLELFIGIPYASLLTHLSAAKKRYTKSTNQAAHRATQDRSARREERERWQRELDDARRRLGEVQQAVSPRAEATLAAVDASLADLRAAREAHAAAEDAHRAAEQVWLLAEQQVMDAKETEEARRVLGRLRPTCCSRCEMPFEADRYAGERQDASCAVCTRPLPSVDPELAAARLAELEAQLEAGREARQQARMKLDAHADALAQAQHRHAVAVADLNEVSVGRAYQSMRELELTVARREGQLQATGSDYDGVPTPPDPAGKILNDVHTVVEGVVKTAAQHLFPDLNRHIVDLARSFGVADLDSVNVQRNGNINAVKDGERTPFDDFSRGERLRMRIATVIALLRISTRRGAASHPGLLLIDAVGAEEVTTEPGRKLIKALVELADELPTLQIVLTTATPSLIEGLLPDDRVITTDSDHMF
ncbi:ATP-binding protein [Micromonospora sp. NPDC126480]|uniref:ATP-binding protein n=1 Tax=Micromonospora sp. NPDC126480 TaxID=3155312 RepID=UPI00332F0A31